MLVCTILIQSISPRTARYRSGNAESGSERVEVRSVAGGPVTTICVSISIQVILDTIGLRAQF